MVRNPVRVIRKHIAIVIRVQVVRMPQVQVVVMEHLEQYLRNVAAAQHPEHVILVNLVQIHVAVVRFHQVVPVRRQQVM